MSEGAIVVLDHLHIVIAGHIDFGVGGHCKLVGAGSEIEQLMELETGSVVPEDFETHG